MRIRAEHRELAAKRHNFAKRRGAVRVGDVALLRRIHDVTAAPEVVEGVIDADLADAVFVRHLHAALHGAKGHALAELQFAVPGFARGKGLLDHLDLCAGLAAAGGTAEQMVQVQRLDGVVRADAVSRGHLAKPCTVSGLRLRIAAMLVGGADECVVGFSGDDVVGGWHGSRMMSRHTRRARRGLRFVSPTNALVAPRQRLELRPAVHINHMLPCPGNAM